MTSTEMVGGAGVALLLCLMFMTIRRNNKRRAAEIDRELREIMREAERHQWK
jgi:hypothetical protein